jgi:hypothetical protein
MTQRFGRSLYPHRLTKMSEALTQRGQFEAAALAHEVYGIAEGTAVVILDVLPTGYYVEAFDDEGCTIDVFYAADGDLRDR